MISLEHFIRIHREEDVRQLALQGQHYPDVDMPYALQQIAGWQVARRKIPSWAAIEGIVYPPHLSLEQCSSEQTARYKADMLSRLVEKGKEKMVDLTGGFGIDFAFMAQMLAPSAQPASGDDAEATATYVECQQHLCDAARKNFTLLGLAHAEVVCADATDYLHRLDRTFLIYLDPARRDAHGSRTYAISDCTPNILDMEEELLQKAEWVMLKLSPMLDWHKTVADLNRMGDVVREVHIVSVANECKELLLLLSTKHQSPLTVCCVNDNSVFSFTEEGGLEGSGTPCRPDHSAAQTYLFEPNSSVMKAGCFDLLQRCFPVTPIGRNSHLFISDLFIEDFPGRKFSVLAISSVNRNAIEQLPHATDKANVAVRNFPMTADALRKKLKLKDGGETFVFGTTLDDQNLANAWKRKTGPLLLIAKKT